MIRSLTLFAHYCAPHFYMNLTQFSNYACYVINLSPRGYQYVIIRTANFRRSLSMFIIEIKKRLKYTAAKRCLYTNTLSFLRITGADSSSVWHHQSWLLAALSFLFYFYSLVHSAETQPLCGDSLWRFRWPSPCEVEINEGKSGWKALLITYMVRIWVALSLWQNRIRERLHACRQTRTIPRSKKRKGYRTSALIGLFTWELGINGRYTQVSSPFC